MPAKLSDFTVIDTIGSGSFGICKRVRRKEDGRYLVWKELDYGAMSPREKEMLVSEVGPPLTQRTIHPLSTLCRARRPVYLLLFHGLLVFSRTNRVRLLSLAWVWIRVLEQKMGELRLIHGEDCIVCLLRSAQLG